ETSVDLINVEVNAVGGSEAIGITSTFMTIVGSSISASQATTKNWGIELDPFSGGGGGLNLVRSIVLARGGQNALGVTASGNTVRVHIAQSEIAASNGSIFNTGLECGGVDTTVDVTDTEVEVRSGLGAENVGLLYSGTGATEEHVLLRGVRVKVEGGVTAEAMRVFEPDGEITIEDSTFVAESATGTNIGINFEADGRDAQLEVVRSSLRATTASFSTSSVGSQADLRFSFDSLSGPFVIPAVNSETISCAAVTDQDNVFYASSCPP
ncbi:MAG: hypothetical protein KJO98_02260, partial [Rhodothermia bacterium]|nr:hypothetical protein [Rhodothermia bacterium]